MDDLLRLASMIYGEGADQDYETKRMIGSSALNRLEAGRPEEFGRDLPEVLDRGYYAVMNPNEPYNQAMSGDFPDEKSEKSFKEALQIAGGLQRGTIERSEGQFYFTDKEVSKLKKKGGKIFDFKAVKEVGKKGPYRVFTY